MKAECGGAAVESGTGILPVTMGYHRQDADATEGTGSGIGLGEPVDEEGVDFFGVGVGFEEVGQSVMGKAGDDHIGAGGEKFFAERTELARGVGQSVEQNEDTLGRVTVGQDNAASAFMQGVGGFRSLLVGPAFPGFVVGLRGGGRGEEVIGGERTEQPRRAEKNQGDDDGQNPQDVAHYERI